MEAIKQAAEQAVKELIELAHLQAGDLVVVGCSTSEICGSRIGTDSRPEVAQTVFRAIYDVLCQHKIYLAAQCCEHLNRALIVEREALPFARKVNVLPQPKAGGSFATAAYATFAHPIAVEHIEADAGLDIGGTLIGMHLKEVAVPLRLSVKTIGEALLLAARTRPKCIGGSRAVYDTALL